MNKRRLYLLFLIVCIFAGGILIWYFFFQTPKKADTLATPTNPLSTSPRTPRFGFITKYFTGGTIPTSTTTTEITPENQQPLVEIWDQPATGETFVSVPILKEVTSTSTVKGTSTPLTITKSVRATSTILMFVDRTTGFIYGHTMDSGKTYQITNTTIPGVYDAYIWGNGKKIIIRYLDDDRSTIISTLATIPSVTETGNPLPLEDTTLLPKNISSIAVSASSEKVNYIVPNTLGSSIYAITSKGLAFVANSPFSEWLLFYGGEQLYATTKPSAYVEGQTIQLPSFTRVIGGKTGLTSIASSAGSLLNSMWSQSGLASFLFSNKGDLKNLSIKTLSSKCTDSLGNVFICAVPKSLPQSTEGLPDDWYQGRASFDDSLSLIDGNTGDVYSLYEFDSSVTPMDAVHLIASLDHQLISFIRRQDGTLWLLRTNLITNE